MVTVEHCGTICLIFYKNKTKSNAGIGLADVCKADFLK